MGQLAERGAEAVSQGDHGDGEPRVGVLVAQATVDPPGKVEGFLNQFVRQFKIQDIRGRRGGAVASVDLHRRGERAHGADLFEEHARGFQVVVAVVALAQAPLDPGQVFFGGFEQSGKGRGVETGIDGRRVIGRVV